MVKWPLTFDQEQSSKKQIQKEDDKRRSRPTKEGDDDTNRPGERPSTANFQLHKPPPGRNSRSNKIALNQYCIQMFMKLTLSAVTKALRRNFYGEKSTVTKAREWNLYKARSSDCGGFQGLRVPGQAVQTGLGHVAEALKSVAHCLLHLVWEALASIVSAVTEAVFDAVVGSVSATGSAVGGLVEKARDSAEAVVKEYLPEIGKEVSDLVVKMVSDALDNYKDALGFVVENVVAN
ncbi:hypothetical protein LINGRAHAP2_LOCUS19440 [Linum grandiflorum]